MTSSLCLLNNSKVLKLNLDRVNEKRVSIITPISGPIQI